VEEIFKCLGELVVAKTDVVQLISRQETVKMFPKVVFYWM
jgi:hypothetical protein